MSDKTTKACLRHLMDASDEMNCNLGIDANFFIKLQRMVDNYINHRQWICPGAVTGFGITVTTCPCEDGKSQLQEFGRCRLGMFSSE